MIKTLQPLLESISNELNEDSVVLSSKRISFLQDAIEYYFSLFNWKFKLKEYNLSTTNNTEYDLASLIDDYDPVFGVYKVEKDGKEIYDYKLSENNKKIIFNSNPNNQTYKIHYYASFKRVSNYTDTLNVEIDDEHKRTIVLYALHLIYNSKRQRNDARNVLFDFKEELETRKVQDASKGSIDKLPRIFKPVKEMLGL